MSYTNEMFFNVAFPIIVSIFIATYILYKKK